MFQQSTWILNSINIDFTARIHKLQVLSFPIYTFFFLSTFYYVQKYKIKKVNLHIVYGYGERSFGCIEVNLRSMLACLIPYYRLKITYFVTAINKSYSISLIHSFKWSLLYEWIVRTSYSQFLTLSPLLYSLLFLCIPICT